MNTGSPSSEKVFVVLWLIYGEWTLGDAGRESVIGHRTSWKKIYIFDFSFKENERAMKCTLISKKQKTINFETTV